jgi:hypothetical protein
MTMSEVFAMENVVGRVRVIKIDVEGMELPILSELVSDTRLLPRAVDIVVEVSGQWYQNGWDDLLPILDTYRRAGFEIAELYNDYLFSEHLPPKNTYPRPLSTPLSRGQADLVLSRRH